MIEIRELDYLDWKWLTDLRTICWPEELNGQSDQLIDRQEDEAFWASWAETAFGHNDVRLIIGAFKDNQPLGAAIGSLAEVADIPQIGMELNGLWIYPEYRGRGLSLALMQTVFHFYQALGIQQTVIYNFHLSPSNAFYRKLGCQVMRQDLQMKENIPVDVFCAGLDQLLQQIDDKLSKYLFEMRILPFDRALKQAKIFSRRMAS